MKAHPPHWFYESMLRRRVHMLCITTHAHNFWVLILSDWPISNNHNFNFKKSSEKNSDSLCSPRMHVFSFENILNPCPIQQWNESATEWWGLSLMMSKWCPIQVMGHLDTVMWCLLYQLLTLCFYHSHLLLFHSWKSTLVIRGRNLCLFVCLGFRAISSCCYWLWAQASFLVSIGNYVRCQGLNLGQLSAKQVPCLLYFGSRLRNLKCN